MKLSSQTFVSSQSSKNYDVRLDNVYIITYISYVCFIKKEREREGKIHANNKTLLQLPREPLQELESVRAFLGQGVPEADMKKIWHLRNPADYVGSLLGPSFDISYLQMGKFPWATIQNRDQRGMLHPKSNIWNLLRNTSQIHLLGWSLFK